MDGSITILIDGNNEGLKRKLSESEKLISESAALAEYAGKKINEMFKIDGSSTADLVKVQTIVQNLAERAAESGKMAGGAYTGMAKEIGGAFSQIDDIVGKNDESIGNLAGMLSQVKEAAANALSNDDSETVARLSVYEEKLKTQMELLRQNAQEAANLGVELFNVSMASDSNQLQGSNVTATGGSGDTGVSRQPDVSWIDGTVEGLEMVSGAFGAAQGAASLFGIESNGLQQVMGKLQNVMSIANGLQTISNGLMKASAFQISAVGGLKKWWAGIIAEAAAAQTAENMSTGAGIAVAQTGTAVNTGFALSFRAIGLAIKSIPILGWVATAVSAVMALYSLFESNTEKMNAQQEEAQAKQAQAQNEFTDNVSRNAGSQIAKLEGLSSKWISLGTDIKAQEKFIDDNQSMFNALGVSINDVTSAQSALVDNKDAFIQALKDEAYAAAYMAQAAKLIEKEIEAEEKHNKTVKNLKIMSKVTKTDTTADIKKEDDRYKNEKESRDKEIGKNLEKSTGLSQKATTFFDTLSPKLPKKQRNGNVAKDDSLERKYKEENIISEYDKKIKEQGVQNALDRSLASVNAMKEGTDKEIAQIEIDYERKEAAIDKYEAELVKKLEDKERAVWKAQNPTKKDYEFDKKFTKDDLSDDQKNDILARKLENSDVKIKKTQDVWTKSNNAFNEYLIKNGTYDQKVDATKSKYKSFAENAGSLGERLSYEKEGKEKVQELNYDNFANPLNLTDVLSNIDSFSLEYVKALRDKIKEYLNSNEGNLRGQDVKVLNDTVDKLDTHVSKKSGFDAKGMKSSYTNVKTTKVTLDKAREKNEKVQGDKMSSQEDKVKAEQELQKAEMDHAKALDGLNNQYQSSIGKVNEYMGAANAITGTLDSFGIEVPDEVKGAMEGIGDTMSSLASINLSNPASMITGIVGAIGGIGKTISSLFNHDGRKQKQIETIQKQIDALDKSYAKLEKSIEDAYSTDASKMIQEQEDMLENQKILIKEQIALEKSKKKTDDSKIQEWEDQLEEIDGQLGDLQDKQIEAICGTDVKSAIDEFAQAYVEAWAAGEDRAKAMKDVVRSVVKSAIVELLKGKLKDQVKAMLDYTTDMMNKGLVPDQAVLDGYVNGIVNSAKPYEQVYDAFIKEDKTRTAATSGIETASQDSIDKVYGTITSLQGHTFMMNENIRDMAVNTALISGYTAQIEAHAKNLQRLESIEINIASMKQDINTINLQGINIKR